MSKLENHAKQLAAAANIKNIWGELIINVKAYGAKGDGVTDDTAAINDALSQISSGEKGILFFPAGGTYRITSPINTGNIDNREVSFYGLGATLTFADSSGLQIRNSNVVIFGFKFNNISGVTASTYPIIDILNVENVKVDCCHFKDLKGVALRIRTDGGSTLPASQDIFVHRCKFENNTSGDIRIGGNGTDDLVERVTMNGCSFESPSSPLNGGGNLQIRAIHVVTYVKDVVISDCHMFGNALADYTQGWRDGIMIGNSTGTGQPERVMISNCSVTGMADDAIGLSGALHVTIDNCILYDSKVTSGVYVPSDGTWTNDYISISNCHSFDHVLAGIFLKHTKNYAVHDCIIENCETGISVAGSSTTIETGIIKGNKTRNVTKKAYYVDNGSLVFEGNTAKGYGDGASASVADKCGLYLTTSRSSVKGNIFEDGIDGVLYTGSPLRFVVEGNIGGNLSGYGHRFAGFSGDEYIVKNNILSGTSGNFANQPTASVSKIYTDNI